MGGLFNELVLRVNECFLNNMYRSTYKLKLSEKFVVQSHFTFTLVDFDLNLSLSVSSR